LTFPAGSPTASPTSGGHGGGETTLFDLLPAAKLPTIPSERAGCGFSHPGRTRSGPTLSEHQSEAELPPCSPARVSSARLSQDFQRDRPEPAAVTSTVGR